MSFADCRYADFEGAIMTGVVLRGAHMKQASLRTVKGLDTVDMAYSGCMY